jgi:predicted Fe-Mo cluster-binding NifX family protein
VNGHQRTQPAKAAFPYWNGRLAPVFDTARRMLVVSISSAGVMRTDQPLVEGAPARRAVQLAEAGIDVLVCGAISRSLHELIIARGITVQPFLAGDLQEVVACWLAGRLGDETFVMPGCRRRLRGVRPDDPPPMATRAGRRRRRGGGGPVVRNRADRIDLPSTDQPGGPAATEDPDRAD